MFRFLKQLDAFLRALAADERIPARDKAILAGLCLYLAAPLDLIPDFLPVIGYLDDAVIVALVLDYVFHVVPEPVILAHFPWRAERYHTLKRWTRALSWFVPDFLRRRLWARVRAPESGATRQE